MGEPAGWPEIVAVPVYQAGRVGLCQMQKPISVSGGGVVMAFTQGRYQRDVLRGPQWRQAPLAGIRMAGAAIEGLQLTAAQGAKRPGAGGGIQAPAGWKF